MYKTLAEYAKSKTKGGSSAQRPGTRGPAPSPSALARRGGGFGNTTPVNGGRPL